MLNQKFHTIQFNTQRWRDSLCLPGQMFVPPLAIIFNDVIRSG